MSGAGRLLSRAPVLPLLCAALAVVAAAPPSEAGAGPTAPRTERISVAPDGSQANGPSRDPAVSGDGRVTAFTSFASNLVPGGTLGPGDVHVRDARDGRLQRVRIPDARTSLPVLSLTGRHLTFNAYVPGEADNTLHVRDLRTGRTEQVAAALDDGYDVSFGAVQISADGRLVVFVARPTDATPAQEADGSRVYLLDRVTGRTERVSHSPDREDGSWGALEPTAGADGRKVAYRMSRAGAPGEDDWSDIFVLDRTTGRRVQADAAHDGAPSDGASLGPALSADGTRLTFDSQAGDLLPGSDPNGDWNPFVRDLRTGALTRVDAAVPTHVVIGQGISGNGGKLLIGVLDRATGRTTALLRDLGTGADTAVTPDRHGVPRGGGYEWLSADASTVVFTGRDTDRYVEGDTNGHDDVFVRRLR